MFQINSKNLYMAANLRLPDAQPLEEYQALLVNLLPHSSLIHFLIICPLTLNQKLTNFQGAYNFAFDTSTFNNI